MNRFAVSYRERIEPPEQKDKIAIPVKTEYALYCVSSAYINFSFLWIPSQAENDRIKMIPSQAENYRIGMIPNPIGNDKESSIREIYQCMEKRKYQDADLL